MSCFYLHFDYWEGKLDTQIGWNTKACAPTVALATKDPLCSKTGAVPTGVGVSPAWAKPARHRSGSSMERRRGKLGRRIWDLGGRSMHRYESLPAPLSCARAGVRMQPLPPPRLRTSHTILTQADWCAVRKVARCEQGLLPVITTAQSGS